MGSKHTFSIAAKTNPLTKQPFGDKYAGSFTVRRPGIGDKISIATREAATLNANGPVAGLVGEDIVLINFIFAALSVIGEEIPAWWDRQAMPEDDDMQAALAVWEEVDGFLKSFRLGNGPRARGGDGEKS